jgi:O-antigen/teichoic acid export membrane protein
MRKISKQNIIIIISRFFALSVTVFTLPLVISNCGVSVFGTYSLLVSLGTLGVVADFGIINSVFPKIVHLYSKQDYQGFNELISLVLRKILIRAVIILFTLCLIIYSILRIFYLDFNDNNDSGLSISIAVTILSIAFGAIINFAIRLLIAMNRNQYSAVVNAIGLILSSVLLMFASRLENPLFPMIVSSLLVPIVLSLVVLALLSCSRRFPISISRSIDFEHKKSRSEIMFWVIQVLAIV